MLESELSSLQRVWISPHDAMKLLKWLTFSCYFFSIYIPLPHSVYCPVDIKLRNGYWEITGIFPNMKEREGKMQNGKENPILADGVISHCEVKVFLFFLVFPLSLSFLFFSCYQYYLFSFSLFCFSPFFLLSSFSFSIFSSSPSSPSPVEMDFDGFKMSQKLPEFLRSSFNS